MKRLLLILFLAINIAAASCASSRQALQPVDADTARFQAFMTQGNKLYQQKNYWGAAEAYREALRIKPAAPKAHKFFADALYELKQYDEAVKEYLDALRLDPGYMSAHMGLGTALYDLKRYQEALAEFQEAVRLAPDDAAAHSRLSQVLIRLHGFHAAWAESEEAYRLRQSAIDRRITRYRHSLLYRPADARLHRIFGRYLEQVGRSELAVTELQEAIRLAPEDANSYNYLGIALSKYEVHRYWEGARAYEQFLRLMPGAQEAALLRSIIADPLASPLRGLLHAIQLGIEQYASDNNGKYPDSLDPSVFDWNKYVPSQPTDPYNERLSGEQMIEESVDTNGKAPKAILLAQADKRPFGAPGLIRYYIDRSNHATYALTAGGKRGDPLLQIHRARIYTLSN